MIEIKIELEVIFQLLFLIMCSVIHLLSVTFDFILFFIIFMQVNCFFMVVAHERFLWLN